MQTHMFNKQNSSYDKTIVTLIVKLNGSGWGLSIMRVRYKLTNITKTKKILKNIYKQIMSYNLKLLAINLTHWVT